MNDYSKICLEVATLTSDVGKFILQEQKKFKSASIEKKGHNDFVSYVDRSAEERLVTALQKIFPEAGFITEENTNSSRASEYNWIIDPLDGTTNFIHGMPCFCISIALVKNEKPVAGVVHELNFDECFYAWENGGCFLNKKKVMVSETKRLEDSLLATGFPYHDYSRMKSYMEVFDYCMRHTHGLRRLGSAAADLAYVACGRFDAFYEYGLNSWDVAAGALLVKEAGGIVNDFSGGADYIFGAEIIASNSMINSELLQVVKERMK